MKRIITFAFGLALVLSSSVAITTNFTSAEGYAAGPVTQHPDWGGDAEGFSIVPGGNGKLVLDNDVVWKRIVHKSGLESGKETYTVTIGVDFWFTRKSNVSLTKNPNLVTVDLYNQASVKGKHAFLGLQRLKKNPKLYRLMFWENIGSSKSNEFSAIFNEKALGFTGASDWNSDKLWLELRFTPNVGTSSSRAMCIIKNRNTGAVVKTLETTFDTDATFFSKKLYPAIGTGDSSANSNVFKRTIESFTATATSSTSKPKTPNMIVMLIDDISTHEFGCYGSKKGLTPRIDSLAEEGLKFKNAWATVTCTSTRATLMSGQYADKHGIYDNNVKNKKRFGKNIPKKRTTLTKKMQDNGYSTFYVGKWHLPGVPNEPKWGFDKYVAYGSLGPPFPPEWIDLYTGWWWYWNGPRQISPTYKPLHSPSATWHPFIIDNGEFFPTKEDDFGPVIICDRVIEFAENSAQANNPFFVYYAMHLTHSPWTEMYDIDEDEVTEPGLEESVKMLDRIVGRLVDGLKADDVYDDTIIFLVGDNPSGDIGKSAQGPLGVHVPYMILGGSNHLERTGTTGKLTDITDIFPTCLDFAGVDPSTVDGLAGKSLKPYLTGESDKTRKYVFAYAGPHRVVRDWQYCYDERWFWRCHPSGNTFLNEQLDIENLEEAEMAALNRLKNEMEKHPPVPDKAIAFKSKGADWLLIRDTGALSPWEEKTKTILENGLEYYLNNPNRQNGVFIKD